MVPGDDQRRTTTPGLAARPGKGRGAVRNVPGRFDVSEVIPLDDQGDPCPPAAAGITTVERDAARTILTRNRSPDVPFDLSINPYRGCEHGCVYCFARPTHSWLDLSPGLDFETRIFVKPHAPELLREELSRPGYVCKPINLGANTDPYQPVERKLRITRSLLEVLDEFRQPVTIVTKSALVLRDLDLLAPMAADGRAAVFVSVTTLQESLAASMEPRAPTPRRRLDTLAALGRAGVPTAVLVSPIVPALNDHELEAILERAAAAGVRTASYLLLRLPFEVRQLFVEWLEAHYPARAAKILNRLRDMREGRLNDPRFGSRMRGRGNYADLLRRRFEIACRRWGFEEQRPELDCGRFRVPSRTGDQLPLFEPSGCSVER